MPAETSRVPAIAIIGGSGLYDVDGFIEEARVRPSTPYGRPSDDIVLGKLGRINAAFLPRHGRGHHIPPSAIPQRANIDALRRLGVRRVVSVSAVGSLREDFEPGHLVVPDQLVDRTTGTRRSTFFDGDLVAHAGFADPFCDELRTRLLSSCSAVAGDTVHEQGTYCCIEGPRFSTRAESHLYRSWGLDIIGMTAVPEAQLAREAEMCYATLALVTDYDCWKLDHDAVDARSVAEVMARNVATAQNVLLSFAEDAGADDDCECHHAMREAILTRDRLPGDPASYPYELAHKYGRGS